MNLLHVKYALKVAEAGSINQAAKSLYISQPHLSGLIKSLEDDIGIPLFIRSKKGVTLTLSGKEFLDNMYPILSEIDSIQSNYYSQRKAKGTIRISSLRSSLFVEGVQQMYEEDSGLYSHISLIEAGFFRVLENVTKGHSDIGFLFNTKHTYKMCMEIVKASGLVYQPLGQFQASLVTSVKTPLPQNYDDAVKALQQYVYVAYDEFENSFLSLGNEHAFLNLPAPKRVIYVSDRDTLFTFLEEKYTYTISHYLPAYAKTKHKVQMVSLGSAKNLCEAAYIKKKVTPLSDGLEKIIHNISENLALVADTQGNH